ncbi:MAG: DUF6596 domain-containing protein [Myxococcota bacterium]
MDTAREANDAVELVARDSYGRLVAWLASRCRDLSLAEDAMSDALEAALVRWRDEGVPSSPEAWLLTVARRRIIDRKRRANTRTSNEEALRIHSVQRLQQEALEAQAVPFRERLPDRRLGLLLACTHPEIPPKIRTALMLQVVLGLEAERIAQVMLVKPATLSQRLVRAKRTISRLQLTFEVPAPDDLPRQLPPILEAVYAAYGTGWAASPDHGLRGLTREALYLARLCVDLAPGSGESKGLLALLCFVESRRGAQLAEGRFVPLEQQDPKRWDHELIMAGERALWLASRDEDRGPFQIEACIQSLHAHRARSGRTDWAGIESLYRILVELYPTIGARIGWAAALAQLNRGEEARAILDALPPDAVVRHQPYWAVRAFVLRALDPEAAGESYERALGLTGDEARRQWLLEQKEHLPTGRLGRVADRTKPKAR